MLLPYVRFSTKVVNSSAVVFLRELFPFPRCGSGDLMNMSPGIYGDRGDPMKVIPDIYGDRGDPMSAIPVIYGDRGDPVSLIPF